MGEWAHEWSCPGALQIAVDGKVVILLPLFCRRCAAVHPVYQQFYDLYETNYEQGIPSFVMAGHVRLYAALGHATRGIRIDAVAAPRGRMGARRPSAAHFHP
jgi:hypothetical protein